MGDRESLRGKSHRADAAVTRGLVFNALLDANWRMVGTTQLREQLGLTDAELRGALTWLANRDLATRYRPRGALRRQHGRVAYAATGAAIYAAELLRDA